MCYGLQANCVCCGAALPLPHMHARSMHRQ